MKIVFIAGAYRGDGKKVTVEKNIAKARSFQKAFAKAGMVAYSPILHDAYWETLVPKEARKTLKSLTGFIFDRVVGAIAVMPGWEQSPGVQSEIERAGTKKKPIFFLKNIRDLVEVKKWYNSETKK